MLKALFYFYILIRKPSITCHVSYCPSTVLLSLWDDLHKLTAPRQRGLPLDCIGGKERRCEGAKKA